ncbi:MAG: hypothetical protein R3D57_00250 [Hyphomicrobiaceae bacterium]
MRHIKRSSAAVLACAAASLLLAGCAETGSGDFLTTSALAPDSNTAAPTGQSITQAMVLEKQGDRKKAFSAASLALAAEPANPDVVTTYSRLAIANGRADDAEKALAGAEAAGVNDWRLLSAKGVVLAEKGDLAGAKTALQKGLELAPEQPALLNNLAFVYALEGNPKMAEDLLRRASVNPGAPARTRQNLALVLGLQGKFEESKKVAVADASPEIAEANVTYLKALADTKGETKLAKAGG